MDSTKNKKQNEEVQEEEMAELGEYSPSDQLSRSRASSVSSATGSIASGKGARTKQKRKAAQEDTDRRVLKTRIVEEGPLEQVHKERASLQEFLLNENNKISKMAARTILAKWAILEKKLQEEIIKNEVLKAENKMTHTIPKSYAQMVIGGSSGLRPGPPSGTPEKGKIRNKKQEKFEVVIIKPEKDQDNRSNDQIKRDVTNKLKTVKNKLKVRGIRQMRKQGIVMEVESTADTNIIKEANLNQIGLKVEKPKRINPSILIYDVEKEYTSEELKDDFITKNCNYKTDSELKQLYDKIEFRHAFKSKENYVNWIVQLPGDIFRKLIEKGKIYME